MNNFNHPALSKNLWSLIRKWQQIKRMSDEDLAACLKVNNRTLKSFDISAHGLTLEKLDNLVTTYGEEPLMYAFTQYLNYISNQNKAQSYTDPQATYPHTAPGSTLDSIMAAAGIRY
jgi:hypothetical protein